MASALAFCSVHISSTARMSGSAARSLRRSPGRSAAVDGDERAVVVRRVGRVGVRDAADLETFDLDAALAQQGEHGLHAHGVRVLDVEREVGVLARELELQPDEHQLDHEHDERGKGRALDIARAAGEADDGRGPEPGGRGQALDALVARDDDRASADEADAGDDLRAEARNVGKQMQGEQQVLARERGDGGAEADEDVRAEARGAALRLALGADHAAADDGQRQPDENGPEAQGADGVKTMQHGTASFLRSLR